MKGHQLEKLVFLGRDSNHLWEQNNFQVPLEMVLTITLELGNWQRYLFVDYNNIGVTGRQMQRDVTLFNH